MNYAKVLFDLFKLKDNEKKSVGQMREIQERKLRGLLSFAWEYSTFYRRAFTDAGITKEQLADLPLSAFPTINKKVLIEHFDELVTVSDVKQDDLRSFDTTENKAEKTFRGYHVVHSSGSKGKPRIVYIAATGDRYGGAMAVGDGIRGVGAEQMYLDINKPLSHWVESIRSFRPNIIIGYPSAIKILGGLVESGEIDMEIVRVISCGEPLNAGLRSFLEKTFQADVVNIYGASESLALGVETGREGGLILFDDLNIQDFLHPLAVEGLCIEGLRDYQFRQIDVSAFEMLAEVPERERQTAVRQEVLDQMRKILKEKKLTYVQFYVRFVKEIVPNAYTGKKPLILPLNEEVMAV